MNFSWFFDAIKSAFNYVLGWVFRGVVFKFGILSILYYAVAWAASEVLSALDISPLTGLQAAMDTIPDSLLWLMNVFALDVGIPLLIGAMVTRFLIRRIPLIG